MNFNLRKFLVENKLTTNSRLLSEAHITPEGELEDLPNNPSSGNKDFDNAFYRLLQLASDSFGDGDVNLLDGLESIMELSRDYKYNLEHGDEGSITDLIEPVDEFNIAFLNTIKATGTDSLEGLQMIRDYATKLWSDYLPGSDSSDSTPTPRRESPEMEETETGHRKYTQGALENADEDDREWMEEYNQQVDSANALVKGGKKIWDMYDNEHSVSTLKKILKSNLGKTLYYYYYSVDEEVGIEEITPQVALLCVSVYTGEIQDSELLPDEFDRGYDFEIYAV